MLFSLLRDSIIATFLPVSFPALHTSFRAFFTSPLTFHQTLMLAFRSGLYRSTQLTLLPPVVVLSHSPSIVSLIFAASVFSFGRSCFTKVHYADILCHCIIHPPFYIYRRTLNNSWRIQAQGRPSGFKKESPRVARCSIGATFLRAHITLGRSTRGVHAAIHTHTLNTHGLSRLQIAEPPSLIEASQSPQIRCESDGKLDPK